MNKQDIKKIEDITKRDNVVVFDKRQKPIELVPYFEVGSKDSRGRYKTSEQFSVKSCSTWFILNEVEQLNEELLLTQGKEVYTVAFPEVGFMDFITGKAKQKIKDAFEKGVRDVIQKQNKLLRDQIKWIVVKDYITNQSKKK